MAWIQAMISSNGSSNGIIWTFDQVGKKLHADDASNVSTSLYVEPRDRHRLRKVGHPNRHQWTRVRWRPGNRGGVHAEIGQ